MKSWKLLGLFALMAALLVMLAACSGGDKGNNDKQGSDAPKQETKKEETKKEETPKNNDAVKEEKKEKVELLFMTLGSNGYEQLVEEWNAANPDIQVKIQNTGDQTAHHNNLLTALSANSGAPDLFHMEIAFIDQFLAHEDKFYNLNDFGAGSIKGNYLDWKWQQASSADGSFQIGLPTDVGPTAVYYRYDLIEEAGLPSDPEGFAKEIDTWEKFASVAKAYTEKTGKPFTDITDLVFNALRDQSEQFIYYDQDGNLLAETNPQIRKAYDYTVQGIQEGWISPSPLWSAEWYNDMNTGGFAVSLSPAWMISTIKGNAPDTAGNWQITQMPVKAGNWGGAFVTLPKEGKHPEQAYAFAEWLLSKEQQLKSFQNNGLLTSIPALYSDAGFTEYRDEFFNNQETGVAFGKAAERVMPIYYGPLHDTTDSYFKNALRNVIEGQADPDAEWQKAVDEANKLSRR